jgi:tripartite ATP-independent transporter DctM subunit
VVLVLGVGFFLFLFIGIPVAFVLGAATLGYVLTEPRLDLQIIPTRLFTGIDVFPIMAIPFFILAGALMNEGGMTSRLVTFAKNLVGHYRGGLAQVNVLASMLMSGRTGSAVADTSAVGGALIPAMVEDRYPRPFAAAVTASSSTMGPILPPSIAMIIYGTIANVSIGALFIAGVVPGILIGLALMGTVWLVSKRAGYSKGVRASWRQRIAGTGDALIALAMPGIILVGMISGVFTATEAGAIAVLYGLIIGLLVYRELTVKRLIGVLLESGLTSAVVLLIIGMAAPFSFALAAERIPQQMADAVLTLSENPIIVLLLITLLLLFVGAFLETTAALIIFVPVLTPIAMNLGIDPIHFGMIVILNLVIGLTTPPLGVCLLLASSIARTPYEKAVRAVLPFLGALLLVLLLVMYVPPLSTALGNFFQP